jgi:hypothetical protein
MAHRSLPADTDPEVFAMLATRWRLMNVGERAQLVEQMCVDVESLARADISVRHPEFSERDICQELARRRYGSQLADAAYSSLRAS